MCIIEQTNEGTFIREKTYTLPITLARGLRIRARTKRGRPEVFGKDAMKKDDRNHPNLMQHGNSQVKSK